MEEVQEIVVRWEDAEFYAQRYPNALEGDTYASTLAHDGINSPEEYLTFLEGFANRMSGIPNLRDTLAGVEETDTPVSSEILPNAGEAVLASWRHFFSGLELGEEQKQAYLVQANDAVRQAQGGDVSALAWFMAESYDAMKQQEIALALIIEAEERRLRSLAVSVRESNSSGNEYSWIEDLGDWGGPTPLKIVSDTIDVVSNEVVVPIGNMIGGAIQETGEDVVQLTADLVLMASDVGGVIANTAEAGVGLAAAVASYAIGTVVGTVSVIVGAIGFAGRGVSSLLSATLGQAADAVGNTILHQSGSDYRINLGESFEDTWNSDRPAAGLFKDIQNLGWDSGLGASHQCVIWGDQLLVGAGADLITAVAFADAVLLDAAIVAGDVASVFVIDISDVLEANEGTLIGDLPWNEFGYGQAAEWDQSLEGYNDMVKDGRSDFLHFMADSVENYEEAGYEWSGEPSWGEETNPFVAAGGLGVSVAVAPWKAPTAAVAGARVVARGDQLLETEPDVELREAADKDWHRI